MSWLFTDDPGGRRSPVEISIEGELGCPCGADRPPLCAPFAGTTAWNSSVSKKDIPIPDGNLVSELEL